MDIRILLIHPVTNFEHFSLLPFDGKPALAAAGPGSCSPPARWKSNFPFVIPAIGFGHKAALSEVTAIKRAANSRSEAPITVSAEGSRKGGVTFYLWCTGRGIPLHASLFTGRLISRNRRGESNRENESKDSHKSFHRASPICAVPERPSLRTQLTALPLRVSL